MEKICETDELKVADRKRSTSIDGISRDAAVDLKIARDDLRKVHRLLDHVLKEVVETEPDTEQRQHHLSMFVQLSRHRRTLQREEERAFRALKAAWSAKSGLENTTWLPYERDDEEADVEEWQEDLKQLMKRAGLQSVL